MTTSPSLPLGLTGGGVAAQPGWKAVLVAGLLAGALDYLAAVVASGAGFVRVGQAIASGVYGRAAFQGGEAMAVQGAVFHFAIMMVIAWTYVFASRFLPALTRRWWLWGPLFGIAVWTAMRFVVVPMSNAVGAGDPTLVRMLIQIGIHMAFVGLPIGFCAARVR